MKGFLIALQFLTRLPIPGIAVDEDDFARSMRWFPAVGLVVGLTVAGAGWAGSGWAGAGWTGSGWAGNGWAGNGLDSWTGALAALVAWVAVTGALHLDGLSDFADASGAAHKDRTRFLAVLADPHVGSFGVVAIGLQLIAKLILLHGLIETRLLPELVLAPFAARIGPLVWTLWLPPLHAGLAARFTSAIGIRHIASWGATLAASAIVTPGLLSAPILIIGWGLWLRRHVGGVSGDCHGAGIELVETGLLAALLVANRF